MSRKPFDKFINKVESGAKKKERIRQEKKKIRAEKNAYFDEQKKLARERRTGNREQGTSYREQVAGYKTQVTGGQGVSSRGQGTGGKKNEKEEWGKISREQDTGYRKEDTGRRTAERKNDPPQTKRSGARTTGSRVEAIKHKPGLKKDGVRQRDNGRRDSTDHTAKPIHKKTVQTSQKSIPGNKQPLPNDTGKDEMPLNKFIAWSGVCGRREAAGLIKAGKVIVNNQVIKEPPFRVSQSDSIKVNGKKIAIQKNLVYILLNKPKDYITTTDDPEGRKTVMDLVKRATTERVFPVGRLDRNTTGVLLITNDGELAQRLTHPKYEVKKIYEVHVDKPVTKQQLDKIASGITLEDGFIQPDAIAYADAKDKSIVGIEIHSGKNRIVRRIFEHMGFKVKNLDRVMYGIFTKKNVDRGKWRLLTEKEIRLLKHLNTSFGNKKTS
ncbi:pseudouridine synthase [Agriterribacter sp.]|uniref:pseudouridine synthase n=1 Tax=Agriterribacter sp. TaxID=2821509 RepID=UPI002BCB705C|nr:pseudouridine synthase [Agriterribacter sp.]HTN07011.1 pseudouridine synthase [Agriterribacter sp.]